MVGGGESFTFEIPLICSKLCVCVTTIEFRDANLQFELQGGIDHILYINMCN